MSATTSMLLSQTSRNTSKTLQMCQSTQLHVISEQQPDLIKEKTIYISKALYCIKHMPFWPL